MEINYIYSKLRSEFGRPCRFRDEGVKVLVNIEPDEDLKNQFKEKNSLEREVLNVASVSQHEINTERVEMKVRGTRHTEGGWPLDVNCYDPDQVARYRKKSEKEDGYVEKVKHMSELVELCIKQNNSINIYDSYFTDPPLVTPKPHFFRLINHFNDFNSTKRPISHISWYPDGGKKFATSYHYYSYKNKNLNNNNDHNNNNNNNNNNNDKNNEINNKLNYYTNYSSNCFVWDIEISFKPEQTLFSPQPIICLEFNSKDPNTLVAGSSNGLIILWDIRTAGFPCGTSDPMKGHKDKVKSLKWIQSKSATDFFTASLDGMVLWWDVRKMQEPVEKMVLDPTRRQEILSSVAAESLEYEPTMPTKFMVGCREGAVLLCNRKAKSPVEKVTVVYKTLRENPIYTVERNPFFLKCFLTICGYRNKIWTEDWKETNIWATNDQPYLSLCSGWSPLKPSIFFSSDSGGNISYWNLLINQKKPVERLQISNKPVRVMKINEEGNLILAGSDDGSVKLINLCEELTTTDKNEKKEMAEFFERETKREKNLEALKKEKRKNKRDDRKETGVLTKWLQEDETEEEYFKRYESQFFIDLEEERKKISRKFIESKGDFN